MIRKKRIALLTSSLRAGGAERVVATLQRNLARDYDVHVILFSNAIEYELATNAHLEFLEDGSDHGELVNILKIPLLARRLVKYCRNNDIDVVVSFLSRPNFVASLAKKMGLKAKVLISERVYTPLWYRNGSLRGQIGKWLTRTLYPFADAILPNSSGTRDALEKLYGIESRYFIIKNPVFITQIKQLAGEPVPGTSFEKFTVICVARFHEQKNHRLLIEAFAKVSGEPRLLLIGKGPLLNAARQQVEDLGLTGRVEFLGYTPNPFKYVSRSGCFVMASDYEGFPNVLLEALACGTPVISTDCLTGPRELLAPGETASTKGDGVELGEFGILVPTGDAAALAAAMSLIMMNRNIRERLHRDGPVRAALYDESLVLSDFREILENFSTN